jgi:hypothetical protein
MEGRHGGTEGEGRECEELGGRRGVEEACAGAAGFEDVGVRGEGGDDGGSVEACGCPFRLFSASTWRDL